MDIKPATCRNNAGQFKMETKFTVSKVTDERNGYDMPKVLIESSTELKVFNRGWNEFACEEDIDETDLLQLRQLLPSEDMAHLEIKTPANRTCCWYRLVSTKTTDNIIW